MNKNTFRCTLLVAVIASSMIALGIASQHADGRQPLTTGLQLTEVRGGPALVTDTQDLEVEVITATEGGFDPAVITRPRGPFILALHNRSGERELVFRIFRAQGEQLNELRLRPGRRSQHQRLELPPGDYVISEANHPAWRCDVTISR